MWGKIRQALGLLTIEERAAVAANMARLEAESAEWATPRRAPMPFAGGEIDMRSLWDRYLDEWTGPAPTMAVATVDRARSMPVTMRRRGQAVPEKLLTSVEWGEGVAGWSGQDFSAGIPLNDGQPLQRQYLIRGRGVNIGSAMELYRGDPTIREGVDTIVDYVRQGRAEYVVPPEVDALPLATRIRAGIDVDAIQRVCDDLNAEIGVNRAVWGDGQPANMLMLAIVAGFSIYEFDFDLDAPVTRRTRYFEQRHPRAVDQWVLDERGRPVAFSQVTPQEGPSGRRVAPVVDLRRCAHAVVGRDGWNPEGNSMLRPAWYWHRFGMEYAESSLMHRKKFGVGQPVFRVLNSDLQGKEMDAALRNAARNFYNSVDSYIAIPPGVELNIMQLQADQGLDAVLAFAREQKRSTMGMGLLGLGESAVGSYALADVRSQVLLRRLNGMVEGVESAWDQYAHRYCEAFHGEMRVVPRFQITGLLQQSFDEALNARERVRVMEQANPDMPIEERNDIRQIAGMPLVEAAEDDGVGTVARRAHVHTSDCGCVTRAKKGVGAPLTTGRFSVSGRDGAFRAFRPLQGTEQHVAFRRLANTIEGSRTAMVGALTDAARRYRDAFAELARPLIEAGDLVALATLTVPGNWPALFEDAIDEILAGVIDEVAEDMREEIASQVGDDWAATEQDSGPSFADLVGSTALLAGIQVADYWLNLMRGRAREVANGAPISTLTQSTPPQTTLAGFAATAVGTAVNATRELVAATEGPKIVRVMRSEIMDEKTCIECEEIDGQITVFGSAEYERTKGQYSRCLSTGSGQNFCRGIDVYEYGA